MTAGCIQSLYSEKSNTFKHPSLPVQQQKIPAGCIKKILFCILPYITADVGLNANLDANCLFLSLPSDIDEP